MMKQRNVFQIKEDKIPPKNLNEMEVSNLPDKEVKVTVIEMLTELSRMDELSENFNRERKYEKLLVEATELKTTITELKIHYSSRQDEAPEWISDLEERVVELTQTEQQKEKKNAKKVKID